MRYGQFPGAVRSVTLRFWLCVTTGLLLVLATSCGDDEPSKPVVVSVEPATATVEVGQTRQFTATVTGTANQGVSWLVDGGAADGTISAAGLYLAPGNVPDPDTVVVRATSVADGSKSATAVVTVTPQVSVSVSPTTVTVEVGQTQQFTATVTGTSNQAVTWTLVGGGANGAISATGLYTAPGSVPAPATVTVRATSVAVGTKSGTAAVTVVAAGPVPAEFVRVPAGSFRMGDGTTYCGTQQHDVTLTEGFYLGQTEVTNQQYLEMVQWAYGQGYVTATSSTVKDAMGSTQELLDLDGGDCEIAFSGGVFSLRYAGHGINPEHPVKEVTWYGAVAYCDWLSLKEGLAPAYNHTTWQCNWGDPYRAVGYRLPTDAEWEYGAQYDDERIYPWGNEAPSCDRANYYGCNSGWTEPVGTQAAGAEKEIGGKGLFDMAGNVWEWCNDWHQCDLGTASVVDPPGPSTGSYRVLRGGSWNIDFTLSLRCSYRSYYAYPTNSNLTYGFRVARTVTP